MSKLDIVLDYLEKKDNHFIDKAMVQVVQMRDDYIFQEIGKVSFKIGVHVDEERLKSWFKMCEELENIPPHIRINLGISAENERLRNSIKKLERENQILKDQLEHIKEVLENEI